VEEEEEEEEVLDLDQRASERAFYIVNGCAQEKLLLMGIL